MNRGKIIFLNGVSSAGKTSLARTIQAISDEPYFHLSYDVFKNMAPTKLIRGDEDSFWNMVRKISSAMHHCIATISDIGTNVIVDTVMLDIPQENDSLKECTSILYSYPILYVGVHCPIEELERREQARGDRRIGQSRSQFDKIHTYGLYDFEVNTHEQSLTECANAILHEVQKLDMEFNPKQRAFYTLYLHFNQK